MQRGSLQAEYFERLYATDADPWHFAHSRYEHDRYRETLGMLGPGLFGRALEIGCSVGVLTSLLAERCAELLAVDINERALAAARHRCRALPSVRFERRTLPSEYPPGSFDLVLLSEVGYYWSDADLALARDAIAASLVPGGICELVHFLPKVQDYLRDGDAGRRRQGSSEIGSIPRLFPGRGVPRSGE